MERPVVGDQGAVRRLRRDKEAIMVLCALRGGLISVGDGLRREGCRNAASVDLGGKCALGVGCSLSQCDVATVGSAAFRVWESFQGRCVGDVDLGISGI